MFSLFKRDNSICAHLPVTFKVIVCFLIIIFLVSAAYDIQCKN